MSVVAAGVGAAVSIGGGIFGASRARREARRRERQAKKLEAKLNRLEANRQQIINPYEGVTSLSGMLSNPFEKLTVATKATELQIEQTDQALANTLDTLRATGASAGGATALAQAALQSKKGVSSSIEQQEAQNEKLRAEGEANLERLQMAEAQRIQSVGLGEAQRVQQAGVAGKQFMFQQKEQREMQQLDRVSAQISGAQAREAQAQSDRTSAITGAIGGLTSIAGSYMSAYGTMNAGK